MYCFRRRSTDLWHMDLEEFLLYLCAYFLSLMLPCLVLLSMDCIAPMD